MGGDKTRGSAQEVQNQIKELSERENTENEKVEMTNKWFMKILRGEEVRVGTKEESHLQIERDSQKAYHCKLSTHCRQEDTSKLPYEWKGVRNQKDFWLLNSNTGS